MIFELKRSSPIAREPSEEDLSCKAQTHCFNPAPHPHPRPHPRPQPHPQPRPGPGPGPHPEPRPPLTQEKTDCFKLAGAIAGRVRDNEEATLTPHPTLSEPQPFSQPQL